MGVGVIVINKVARDIGKLITRYTIARYIYIFFFFLYLQI